jgi:DNA helicase HerA-like ATPase
VAFGKREVIIILGKTGFGKSTWLKKYLAGIPRSFIFDPFRDIQAQYLTPDELIAAHESKAFQRAASFSIGAYSPNDFDLIGSIAFLTGQCHLVIEECGVAFYKGERIPEWLQEAIFLGRHVSLSLIFTAQRAASIPIDLRSQASRFVSFRQTEQHDLKWARDYLGDHFPDLPYLDELECLDADNKSVTRYRIAPLGN